jgi:hypothetical protein
MAQALASAEQLVERVRLVPSSLRRFVITPKEAQRVYGMDRERLESLLDLGLPSKMVDGIPHCDRRDIANVAVYLGLPSLQQRVLMGSGRTLEAVSRESSATYVLEYQTRCVHCPPATNGSYEFLVPPGRRVAMASGGKHTVEVRRPTVWPTLPPEAEAVSEHLASFWFWQLPSPLREDVGFAREHLLAGCYLAAQLVMQESRRVGLETRVGFGIQVTVPFSEVHYWNDVHVDGVWVPFDPHLMRILARRGGLEASEWPPTRSPGAILVPVRVNGRENVAMHDGHVTRPSIATWIGKRPRAALTASAAS